MIGAVIGDVVGSSFEFRNHKDKEFPLFTQSCKCTDVTIMTAAIACSVAEAYYGVPWNLKLEVYKYLPLSILEILECFE